MTKDISKIKDPRSTMRRHARRALYLERIPYKCIDCGKTSKEPPKDQPAWFEDLWPIENRVLDYSLQADHESKDLYNNSIEFLNWRCQPCHKTHDGATGKGQSTVHQSWF